MTLQDTNSAFRRFQETGDPQALAQVFDHTAAELLRVANHLVRDLNDAEDLVQATFLTAIEYRHRFRMEGAEGTAWEMGGGTVAGSGHDSRGTVLSWLVGILMNLARRRRAATSRYSTGEIPPMVVGEDPGKTLEAQELSEAVSGAINRLSE